MLAIFFIEFLNFFTILLRLDDLLQVMQQFLFRLNHCPQIFYIFIIDIANLLRDLLTGVVLFLV